MVPCKRKLASARSFLFVPGDRPDRFARAIASGADVVILDLEDSVAPSRKEAARHHVSQWLNDDGSVMVRINGMGTDWHDADVELLATANTPVMVPKAEDPEALGDVMGRLSGSTPLIPLVETPLGIHRAVEVCRVRGVVRAAFGAVDLGGRLGIDHGSHAAFAYPRGALVIAAGCAGVAAPIDSVTTDLRSESSLVADLAHAVQMGFTAKMCIHPTQVDPANDAFGPSATEVAWAERIVSVGTGSAVQVEGEMVDRPVVLRAESILRAAGRRDEL